MQDTKSEASINTVKLSFLILLCVTEDQYANALMHDPNLVFAVKLHRAPMRHRKISTTESTTMNGQSRSLACSVMDLMVEFIRSHLMKRFPHDLYLHSLYIIHRLLSYQVFLFENPNWRFLPKENPFPEKVSCPCALSLEGTMVSFNISDKIHDIKWINTGEKDEYFYSSSSGHCDLQLVHYLWGHIFTVTE